MMQSVDSDGEYPVVHSVQLCRNYKICSNHLFLIKYGVIVEFSGEPD